MLSGHFPLSLQVKANGTGNQASKDGRTPTEMARFSTCQTSSRTTTVLASPLQHLHQPQQVQRPVLQGHGRHHGLPELLFPDEAILDADGCDGCDGSHGHRLTNWRCRFLTKDINRELRKSRHPSPFELTLARNICSPVIWTDRRPLGGRPTLVPGHSFAANVSERVCRCAQHLATSTNFGDLPTSSY